MGTYQTLTQLRAAQVKRFAAIKGDINQVHTMIARDGKGDFEEQTVGTVSTKTLRQMGHPFGRMGGAGSNTGVRGVNNPSRFKGIKMRKGVLPPLPINRQKTNGLHSSIKQPGPSGATHRYDLYADAPYAKYVLSLTGTKRMTARGLLGPWGLLRKRHKARIAAYVDLMRRKQRAHY